MYIYFLGHTVKFRWMHNADLGKFGLVGNRVVYTVKTYL